MQDHSRVQHCRFRSLREGHTEKGEKFLVKTEVLILASLFLSGLD